MFAWSQSRFVQQSHRLEQRESEMIVETSKTCPQTQRTDFGRFHVYVHLPNLYKEED
jgi:hypothetical protein